MSHLTTSLFHKPSPFDVTRSPQIPTPPDTDIDYSGMVPSAYAPQPFAPGLDMHMDTPPSYVGPPRRTSTLAYHHSNLREARERPAPRAHSKWLVVVTPPQAISREHGQLGHTLSSGPPGRLSQGILLPLFPTMYAQLTVIAREFNFPSTAGICLYLGVPESTMGILPRISDETWPILWNHLFEARSPALPFQQLPVCGRIEFDIDLHKARWYDAWLSSSRRQQVDVPASLAPSLSHWREESKTTLPSDELAEEEDTAYAVPARPSLQRHIPRKLSLLDRLDSSSAIFGLVPPSEPALPTIAQEEPPAKALQTRVKSWRAGSSVAPTALASTGQVSLDPVHMPNSVPLDDVPVLSEQDAELPLNLDDFTWSVSSPGPGDYDDDLDSPLSWARDPSVHLDRRLQGSVLLSPSIATSFGPDDDYVSLYSLVSRLPSPDIAMRMVEDVPPTPSTATSWGAPLDYPPSPLSLSRPPSVDIAYRAMSSRPPTPSTATSWGPSSWPSSPAYSSVDNRAPSIDLGERVGWSQPVTPMTATSWGPPSSYPQYVNANLRAPSPDLGQRGGLSRPVTPSTATSWGAPSSYPPSPFLPEPVPTPDAGHRAFDADSPPLGAAGFVFPYFTPSASDAWQHVWPYHCPPTSPPVARMSSSSGSSQAKESTLDRHMAPPSLENQNGKETHRTAAWQHVWPLNESQTVSVIEVAAAAVLPLTTPKVMSMKDSSSPRRTAPAAGQPLRTGKNSHPFFNLRSPVSAASASAKTSSPLAATAALVDSSVECLPNEVPLHDAPQSVTLSVQYPSIDIYPTVYPNFEIYPGHVMTFDAGEQLFLSVHLPRPYPQIEIYSTAYPNFEIYPGYVIVAKEALAPISVRLPSKYPALNIYPSVYPELVIYPPVSLTTASGFSTPSGVYPNLVIYPPVGEQALVTVTAPPLRASLSTRLPPAYPRFDLYPAVYPTITLYPRVAHQTSRRCSSSQHVVDGIHYPVLYPFFDLYPSLETRLPVPTNSQPSVNATAGLLPATYPRFAIYPAAYPNFEIYAGEVCDGQLSGSWRVSTTASQASYPHFAIYPAVYPNFEIYAVEVCDGKTSGHWRTTTTALLPLYPHFAIYPAAYPHFEIYAGEICDGDMSGLWRVSMAALQPQYPNFDIYPAVYPYFDIYRSGSSSRFDSEPRNAVSVTLPAFYPAIQLYPAVYPHFEIWPSVLPPAGEQRISLSQSKKSHQQPHLEAFARNIPASQRHRQRKTHRELHEEVLKTGRLVSVSAQARRPRETHEDLHYGVFKAPTARSVSFADPETSFEDDSVRPQKTYPKTSAEPLRAALKQPPSLPPTSAPPPVPALPTLVSNPLPHVPSRPPTSSHPPPPVPLRPVSASPLALSPPGPPPRSSLPAIPSQSSSFELPGEPVWEMIQPAPKRSDLRIQVNPLRRASSTRQPVLSPVDEAPSISLQRSKSQGQAGESRMVPRRRDSLVMEKARMFDLSSGSTKERDTPPISMSALSEFPLPPASNGGLGRPVGKLDRARFSFQ